MMQDLLTEFKCELNFGLMPHGSYFKPARQPKLSFE